MCFDDGLRVAARGARRRAGRKARRKKPAPLLPHQVSVPQSHSPLLPFSLVPASSHVYVRAENTTCKWPIVIYEGARRQGGGEERGGGREGREGRDRQDLCLCLSVCWLRAACQLGLFPRPPPTLAIAASLSPISDGRMVRRRRRCAAS